MSRPLDLSLYLVTDTALCGGPDGVVSTVGQAVDAGVTVVQLRDPYATDPEFVALGRRLARLLAGTGIPLIVNDRAHLVREIGAQGVHVGQGDLPVAEAREFAGPGALLGLSVASSAHVRAAAAAGVGVDYLGAQALRSTATKPEAGEVGLPVITAIAGASPWPVVAIGGVRAGDAADLRRAGCAGMAVVSAICGQDDIRTATRGLVDAWERAGAPA